MTTPARSGEFDRIARIFAPLAGPEGLGLTDDAAVWAPAPDRDLVTTVDAMVAGVHFLPDDPPETVGRKLLRVNLSDLAAMGATPRGYLLVTALPRETEDGWLAAFAGGVKADQERYGITLFGGDSVSTPGPMMLSLTAIGDVPRGRHLGRGGARPGDGVFVSGTVGDAALGLLVLRDGALSTLAAEHRTALADRYRHPQPRTALGPALLGVASAAMDVSDGLFGDLRHVCRASGCGIEIDAAVVPWSPAVTAALALEPGLRPVALAGGDDYELVFTCPPDREAAVADIGRDLDVRLSRIGRVVAGDDVSIRGDTGPSIDALRGWVHF